MTTPKELASLAQTLSQQMAQFAQALSNLSSDAEGSPETPESPQEIQTTGVETSTHPQVKVPFIRLQRVAYNDDPSIPGYDPSPPFQVERVPPRSISIKPEQKVIASGSIFVCRACNVPIVRAVRDIYNSSNHERGLSVKAFEILDKRYDWPESVQVDQQGGVCVSCPACGRMGLWLIGSPKVKEGVNSQTGITENSSSI